MALSAFLEEKKQKEAEVAFMMSAELWTEKQKILKRTTLAKISALIKDREQREAEVWAENQKKLKKDSEAAISAHIKKTKQREWAEVHKWFM